MNHIIAQKGEMGLNFFILANLLHHKNHFVSLNIWKIIIE